MTIAGNKFYRADISGGTSTTGNRILSSSTPL